MKFGVWLLLPCLAACPAKETVVPADAKAVPFPLYQYVARLEHPAAPIRQAAGNDLDAYTSDGLSLEHARWMLRAARRSFLDPSVPQRMVAWGSRGFVGPEIVPAIAEVFVELPPEGQAEALTWLTKIKDPAASTAFVKLLEPLPLSDEAWLDLTMLREEPRDAQHYFPALFRRLDSGDWFEITHTTLAYLEAGALTPDVASRAFPGLLERWRQIRPALRTADGRRGMEWRWDPDYSSPRADAALLLDVFGHLPGAASEAVLKEAMKLRDPRLLVFATTAALQVGLQVPGERIAQTAAFAEVRCLLYERLANLEQLELMPEVHRTQAALAEGDLARWLSHPDELGRAPDQLELFRVEHHSNEEGQPQAWFLFRFRTEAPHPLAERGWMAGVAGPYPPDAVATTGSGTFTDFVSWGELEPDEHSQDLRARSQPPVDDGDD